MYTAFLSAPFGAGRYGSAGRSAQTERTRAHDFLPEAVGAGTGGRATTLRRRCGRGRVAGGAAAGHGTGAKNPGGNVLPGFFDLFLFAFEKGFVGFVGLVGVRFGEEVVGSVHAEHGGAAVHDFRAPVGHHEGDGAAAALVDFAEFADLPGYAGFVEDGADLLEEFGEKSRSPPRP